MFKISKLLDVSNENTTISFVSQEYCKIDVKKLMKKWPLEIYLNV